MVERAGDNAPRPLPRDWLPEATAPEGAPEWDVRVARIIAAAEPTLRRLGKRRSEIAASWPTMLGSWWKSAAALATAAAALLFMLKPETIREPAQGWLPLSVVAAEGEPFALWEGLGISADPVLALIALQQEDR